jgi:hypothetical protein
MLASSIDELDCSVATRLVLDELGVTTFADVQKLNADAILEIGNRGVLKELRQLLGELGLALANEPVHSDEEPEPEPRVPGTVVVDSTELRIVRRDRQLEVTFTAIQFREDPDTGNVEFLELPPSASSETCSLAFDVILREALPTLIVVCDPLSPGDAWATRSETVRLDTIESLVFDTFFQPTSRQSDNSIGDLSATLRSCANLQRCFATGKLQMTPTSHDRLRELYVNGVRPEGPFIAALARCRIPQLERCAIAFDCHVGDSSLDVLGALPAAAQGRLREVFLQIVDEEALVRCAKQLARHAPAGSLQRLAFGFDGGPDEDVVLESLAELSSLALASVEVGLPLDARFSRRFARAASTEHAWLRDSSSWKWATALPKVYYGTW